MHSALGLLNELTEEDIAWLFQAGFERQVTAKTVIVRENEPISSLHIVLEGLFAVTVFSLPDSELGRLGPGEIIGEISFLENSVPSASVIALESSLLLEISTIVLSERLESNPAFAAQFYKALAILNSRRVRERVSSLTRSFHAKLEAHDWNGQPAKALIAGVERFKSLLLQVDAEAIKTGGQILEATAMSAEKAFIDFCRLVHLTLRDQSPESSSVKTELGQRLQREILPFLLLTQTAERFYSKPRGYAGDFLTLEMVYENHCGGTGRLGPLLDRCFLNTPPARAMRNRHELIAKEIEQTVETRDEFVHVTSLAGGPARELFDLFAKIEDPRRVQVSLLDIDLQALAHVAERRDKARLQNRINLINANLVYLAMGWQRLDLKDQDLIYSLGLTDYFNDRFVIKLLDWVYHRLRSGGRVILGNFHPDNYCREMMGHLLEWKLVHRTEEDMNRIFTASAFRRPCTRVQFETEGVILFAECVKE